MSTPKRPINDYFWQPKRYNQLALLIPGSRLNSRNTPSVHPLCNRPPLKKFHRSNKPRKFINMKFFYTIFFNMKISWSTVCGSLWCVCILLLQYIPESPGTIRWLSRESGRVFHTTCKFAISDTELCLHCCTLCSVVNKSIGMSPPSHPLCLLVRIQSVVLVLHDGTTPLQLFFPPSPPPLLPLS